MTRTLVLLKPDAIERNLIGELIKRFELANLKIKALKMLRLSEEQARKFYAAHKTKPFYENLVKYITSGKVVALILDGDNAINKVRALMGATDPSKALKGTIRGDYGLSIEKNTVHGSDSEQSASYEIPIIFNANDFSQ
jgi:nucleoside-diphosphate kinase